MRSLFFWLTNRRAEPAPERVEPRHEAIYTFTTQPPTYHDPALASETVDQLEARRQLETGIRPEREDC